MKPNNRSPLTDKPLRNPGQSLERLRDDLLLGKVLIPILMVWFMIVMIAWEWWCYFNPTSRNPIIITVVAIITVLYIAFSFQRTWRELKQLRQGIEGEKAVGQYLERLRTQGYQIFHDLIGEKN